MPIAQSRRRFMTSAAAAGDAALIGSARARRGGPETQDLPARKVGRAIVDMARDKLWAHYFRCMMVGHTVHAPGRAQISRVTLGLTLCRRFVVGE